MEKKKQRDERKETKTRRIERKELRVKRRISYRKAERKRIVTVINERGEEELMKVKEWRRWMK